MAKTLLNLVLVRTQRARRKAYCWAAHRKKVENGTMEIF
jgi:hypothetical protein